MGKSSAIEQGEAYVLKSLISKKTIYALKFEWFDTGTPQALHYSTAEYKSSDDPFILPKENECIWFIKDQVIKFSSERLFISNRVKKLNI